jgi:chaperone BCS1
MTTNHPEKLDEALIRPGRVDQQVEFKNATQKDAAEMFERMYTKDLPYPSSTTKAKDIPIPTANETANGTPITAAALNSIVEHGEEEKPKEEPSDELSQTAEKFGKKVPDGVFSQAEIQGFLLKRKNDPRKALNEVGDWVKGMKEVKENGSKLLQVQ